jgi:hypothetical protein
MYPGAVETMKSLLMSDVDDGCCFSIQTRRHDVSRQVSISVNGVSVEMSVYVTHPAMTFYAFEVYTLVLLHAAFHVLTVMKKLKKAFLSFLVLSTEMSRTKRKRCHKVKASSYEEDDAWRPGVCVNVRPRAQKKGIGR